MSTAPVSFSELETAATPTPAVAEKVTPAVPETPSQPQFTEADAQALRALADLGITPQNAADFVQAKTALNNLPALLRTNPRAVLAEIAKNDPEAYNAVLEATSDEWFEKWQREHPEGTQPTNGGPSRSATSSNPQLEAHIQRLESQLQGIIAEKNQENTARQNKAIQDGFDNTIEGMIAKLPKEVPESAKDYIRLKTRDTVLRDPQASQRIARGVYVDVSKYFADASAKATADFKAAAKTEHDTRSAVESRGNREIVPAAEAVNGVQATGPQEDAIWGDTGLARDTQVALKQK